VQSGRALAVVGAVTFAMGAGVPTATDRLGALAARPSDVEPWVALAAWVVLATVAAWGVYRGAPRGRTVAAVPVGYLGGFGIRMLVGGAGNLWPLRSRSGCFFRSPRARSESSWARALGCIGALPHPDVPAAREDGRVARDPRGVWNT
jgi:hypothetical protein